MIKETTQFQVYKTNSKGNIIWLILMLVMSIAGLLGILIILISNNPKFLQLEIFSYILLLWQGILGIFLARNNLKNLKYFVSWDDNEIQYLLLKNKEIQIIKIQGIQSVEKPNQEFRIVLKNNEIKNFNFIYFYYPTRQTILNYFETLQ